MEGEAGGTNGPVRPPDRDRPGTCLDCGAQLLGGYCHRCGQRHGSRIVPVGRFVAEALSDLFSVDGRLARTLTLLFRRPGGLTEAYLAGRRTRYVPPFRLYLVASAVYFGVLAVTGTQRFLLFTVQGPASEEFAGFVEVLPRLMFVLVPVFAALLHASYARSGRLYGEHLVLALHYHAVVFLLFPLDALLGEALPRGPGSGTAMRILEEGTRAVLFLYLLAHLVIALRRVYGGSRAGAGLRSVCIWGLYSVLLGIAGTMAIPPLRKMLWSMVTGG